MYETIRIDQQGEIAVLTFNRPDKLNAINRTVYEEMGDYLRSIERGYSSASVLILTGEGRAFVASQNERQPFGLMFEALDALQANEVYICTGSSPTYALWGELMSTRALKLGAAGAVLDGYHRVRAACWRLDDRLHALRPSAVPHPVSLSIHRPQPSP